jgi:hypothetical protein
MRNLANDTQIYTGILTPFNYESDLLIVVKNSREKVYAKLDEGVGINPFNHYFARVSIVKIGGENIAVEIDYIAENLDRMLLSTLLAHVPKRSEKHLEYLLHQLMCISDPLLRHLILGVLCDDAILPLLLSTVSINDKSLFEKIIDSTSVVIEQLYSVDMQDLDRDCLITVSLLREIANNVMFKNSICSHYSHVYNLLDFLVVKFLGLKHPMIASLVIQHMELFMTDFDFMFYIEQVIEVCEEGLPVFSVLELIR